MRKMNQFITIISTNTPWPDERVQQFTSSHPRSARRCLCFFLRAFCVWCCDVGRCWSFGEKRFSLKRILAQFLCPLRPHVSLYIFSLLRYVSERFCNCLFYFFLASHRDGSKPCFEPITNWRLCWLIEDDPCMTLAVLESMLICWVRWIVDWSMKHELTLTLFPDACLKSYLSACTDYLFLSKKGLVLKLSICSSSTWLCWISVAVFLYVLFIFSKTKRNNCQHFPSH